MSDAPLPSADADGLAPARPWHAVDHAENFPVGSWLVPARLRSAVVAIYRFARHADDIADEGDADAATREARLLALDHALAVARAGAATGVPVVDALAPAMARHRLGWTHLHDLIDAFRQDLRVHRFADAAAVQSYCDRSACPVGRLMLELFEAADAGNRRDSDAICSALQKINFLQDLTIDLARGRVYLPRETLAGAGLDEAGAGVAAPGGRALAAAVRVEAVRAREQLLSGAGLVARVPLRLGLELRFIVAGGMRILERLALADFDAARGRPVLGWRDAPALLRLALRPDSRPVGRARLWQAEHA